MRDGDPASGLMEAARVFAARCAQRDPEPVDAFLRRHEALREWLEPMLDDAPPDAAADEPAERTLGPFVLGRELGRGGMGVVYEARPREGGAPVALKVLPDFLALREGAVARFERETDLARRLDHPGIVRVLEAGSEGSTRFLAMELVAGAPLDRVLRVLQGQRPETLRGSDLARAIAAACQPGADVPPADAQGAAFAGSYVASVVRLALQLADALGHAHAAGVIHRDVKPGNILVCPDGRAVLTDFGLARDTGPSSLTVTGDFAGTPYYVSPEQAMAKRVPVDHRTDQFSLGSTLYELLTLRRPFDGETTQEVFARILTKEPGPPARLNPGLADDLVTILLKLLEKDPDRRYPDATHLAADLRAFLEYRPVAALRASTFTRVVRWTRREPLKAAVVGMLALGIPLLAGGAGYLYARADEIRAGRAQLLARAVEDTVEQGFVDLMLERQGLGVSSFERALELAPRADEAQIGLVFALLRRDGAEAALARLDALADHVQPGLLGRLRMGMLLRLGRSQESAVIEATLGEARTEFELFVEGIVNRDRGDHSGSRLIEFIERAVLAAPRPLLWIHVHWAVYADEMRDASSCRRCAANLMLNWPDSPIASYFACVALRGVEPERAEALVERALSAHPDSGLLYGARGMVCRTRRDREGALAAFERAAELMPGIPTFQYMLGSTRLDAGDAAGALAALRSACELSPTFVAGWVGLGMVQAMQDDLDGAAASLRRAVELHPSHGTARFQLGEVLLRRGEDEAGLQELREGVRLHSRDTDKSLRLAAVYAERGDAAAAEATLRAAAKASPAHEGVHRALVAHLRAHGTPAAVRAALTTWVDAAPRSSEAWLALAAHGLDPTLPPAERDAPGALWAARRALTLTAEASGLAWYRRGEAHALLGEPGPARDAWRRALAATDPLPDDLREACRARLAASEAAR